MSFLLILLLLISLNSLDKLRQSLLLFRLFNNDFIIIINLFFNNLNFNNFNNFDLNPLENN
jgi:hypothetical protein